MRRFLLYDGDRGLEVREAPPPRPAAGEVQVVSRLSAISAGSELLVFRGEAGSEIDPSLPGVAARYPTPYGYAVVGRVAALGEGVDAAWEDRRVFALHPHDSHFLARPDDLLPIPDELTDEDAVFFANAETAVNLLLDGRPRIGERVAVHGQGVVGLLTTGLLAAFPLGELVVRDPRAERRRKGLEWGADHASAKSERTGDFDLVYELTGHPDALDGALADAGFDARVVVGSWYGTRPMAIDLGSRFHRERLRLVSSQVSTLAPELGGRWNRQRRRDVTWRALSRLRPSRLVTHRFGLASAGDALRVLDEGGEPALQVLLTYDDDREARPARSGRD